MPSASYCGQLRWLATLAIEQGWRVEQTTSCHWRFLPKDRRFAPLILAATPSDGRGIKNALAALRRAGLVIPRKGSQ